MPDVSYLTAEGAARLKGELDYLKGPSREQLAARLHSAIQQGDLSEKPARQWRRFPDRGFHR